MNRRLLLFSLAATSSCSAFVTPPPRGFVAKATRRSLQPLFSTTDEINSMRAGEIKKELESYGISTRSFLEKKELVEALQKARDDGLKPKASSTSSTSTPSSASSSTSPAPSPSSSSSDSSKPRDERLAEEMAKCKTMKNGELKKELESRGISTKSFFEKSEFIKALAEAIVDGVDKKGGNDDGEGYAEYANVEVLTSDDAGPRKKQSQQQEQQQPQSPFGGGGSPFGGGMPGGGGGSPFGGGMPGGMPGGMGGMGGIGDMLKNMGMGGGGGGSPFGGGGGGGGGSPFGGDPMGQAQEMMKNPKVMQLMMKAQSNPKLAKAMQEVMSNPAAFAKYQNDPEVAEFIKELQQVM